MMGSPFPGMDPYLERHWLDVHTSLVASARNALNENLPDDLIARSEERIAVESDRSGERPRRFGPDVRVFQRTTHEPYGASTEPGSGGTAVLAPYRLEPIIEPIKERFVEIIDPLGGDRIVTVVEFLSPTNKQGRGLKEYRVKREQLIDGGVNVVEINLIRAGGWRELILPYSPPFGVDSTYCASIYVGRYDADDWFHPIYLNEPLPSIKIPLRPGDAPVDLALQPLIEAAYQNGRYARTIDYSREPDPPLAEEEAAWADDLLRKAGRRPAATSA